MQRQALAPSGQAITLTVTRGMLGSSRRVSVAAFAVSQPPPRPQTSVTAQQLLLILLPQVAVAPPPSAPPPSTTTAPALPPQTTTPAPAPAGGMDGGALAAVVLACVVVVAALGVALYLRLGRPPAAQAVQQQQAPSADTTALHAMFQSAGTSVAKFSRRGRRGGAPLDA